MANQAPANMTTTNGGGQSQAIVKGPQARLKAIKDELANASKSLAMLLPKHVTIDRMVRIVTSSVSRTPQLLDCTPQSIVLATAQACALGLEPNQALGLGYLVPFGREAQFIPGYRGLVRLAVQSGEVQWVQSRIVHEKDTFEVEYGTEQRIVHKPFVADEEAGRVIGAYAVAEMKNGAKLFEFMTIAQLDAIRRRSKSADSGPWKTDTTEMYRKTVVRRLCKSLPLSEERLERALHHQARAEAGDGPDYSDVIDVLGSVAEDAAGADGSAAPDPSRTDAARERLQQKAAQS